MTILKPTHGRGKPTDKTLSFTNSAGRLFPLPPDDLDIHVSLDDYSVIYYTAGTTGLPKGALRTHQATYWTSLFANWLHSTPYQHESIVGCVAPFFHIAGWECTGCLPTILVGGTQVIFKRFDAEKVFEGIEKFRINLLFLVPAMLITMQNVPNNEKYDCSSLKSIVTVAAPLTESLAQ